MGYVNDVYRSGGSEEGFLWHPNADARLLDFIANTIIKNSRHFCWKKTQKLVYNIKANSPI